MLKPTAFAIAVLLSCAACDSDKQDPAKPADSAKSGTAKTGDAKSAAPATSATATASAEAGGDACEQAYTEVKALIEGFKNIPGNQAKPTVPAKDEFIKACEVLPADVQECMKVSELMKDPAKAQDCKKRLDELPPDVKDKATKLMEQAQGKGQ